MARSLLVMMSLLWDLCVQTCLFFYLTSNIIWSTLFEKIVFFSGLKFVHIDSIHWIYVETFRWKNKLIKNIKIRKYLYSLSVIFE